MKNSELEQPTTTGWLATFNDLITLLMVFFVLVFSMSTIDTKKMKNFQYALQSGLGVLKEGKSVSIGLKELRTNGSTTIVQSLASCLIPSMPESAIKHKAAKLIMGIDEIILFLRANIGEFSYKKIGDNNE